MSGQKPERCYHCGIIISQIEGKFWVQKQDYWTFELHSWSVENNDYQDPITERICDKCKNELIEWLNKK